MNIRAAFLHNIADALGSVAVIIGGTLIILTILAAIFIFWDCWEEIGGVIRVLMLGSPPSIETKAAYDALTAVDGIEDVHHFHLWMMEEKLRQIRCM